MELKKILDNIEAVTKAHPAAKGWIFDLANSVFETSDEEVNKIMSEFVKKTPEPVATDEKEDKKKRKS